MAEKMVQCLGSHVAEWLECYVADYWAKLLGGSLVPWMVSRLVGVMARLKALLEVASRAVD
jgi:hypothetical protein